MIHNDPEAVKWLDDNPSSGYNLCRPPFLKLLTDYGSYEVNRLDVVPWENITYLPTFRKVLYP